jgi:hypothetical protein
MNQKTRFWALLLIVFGFGLFLSAAPWEKWASGQTYPFWGSLFRHVLPKIGDAFMIAPVLAIVVEIEAAQKLVENFVFNVSHHIIGRLLPPELREHILGYLRTDFIRRHWLIEYKLEAWPTNSDFVQLTSTIAYQLENRSGSEKDYPFAYELELSYAPEIGEPRIFHVCATLDGRALLEHTEQDLKKLVKLHGPNITFSTPVRVTPQPHGIYRFTAESVECLPDDFESAFIAAIPVLETTVRIRYPKDKMTVDLFLSFGDETVLHKNPLVDGAEWVINSPILPGQCILTRWSKIRPIHRAALPGAVS